ncbi:hypothetical protein TNIN_339891 [Trichonephila inaurata madagascariensis]|uniref:Uncharacterized protein n=1 Tax=Trichonephila inaurata madagascariensis TaxID=2747483 RepID=A0A8X7BW63_9ARAC|nr:hypothetical protein TNIN_339891 [Trichonephila inaurata madagascariensis]
MKSRCKACLNHDRAQTCPNRNSFVTANAGIHMQIPYIFFKNHILSKPWLCEIAAILYSITREETKEEEDEDFPESVRVCRGGNALSPVLNSPAICERKGRKKGVRERKVGRQKEGWSSIKRVVPGPTNGNPAEKPRDGPSCICIVCNDIPKRNWKGVSGKRGGIFKRRERFEERNKV